MQGYMYVGSNPGSTGYDASGARGTGRHLVELFTLDLNYLYKPTLSV